MSRKNGSKSSTEGKGDWRGFVNVPLGTSDTIDVIEHATGGRSLDDAILEILSDGYKLSLSPLRDGSGFAVSVTGKDETDENYGYTMTTFAGTPYRGVLATWYKINVICEGGAWKQPDVQEGLEI